MAKLLRYANLAKESASLNEGIPTLMSTPGLHVDVPVTALMGYT